MESLPSSWQSGSFSFVSPKTHQPPVHPLTTATTSSPNALPFCSNPRRRKMAKVVSATTIILVLAIVVTIVVCDTLSQTNARSKLRSKSLAARKRRPMVETTTIPTLEADEEESVPDTAVVEETTTLRPRSRKSHASGNRSERPPRNSNSEPLPEGCGECDMSTCKSYTEKSCQIGLVLDRCSCCNICGSGEGNRCYNSSIPNLPITPDVGICATGLFCILRKDLDSNEPREALCECRDRRLVCGNDNRTYSNECKLREAAYKSSGLAIASYGACVSAPWIPTSIENITVSEGQDASLSCEVRGFPSAVIHWEFLPHGSSGAPKILPGDDSNVVVTVRGGPEQTMSTSWIQIVAVTDERIGTYYCVATNAHGVARNHATVLISA